MMRWMPWMVLAGCAADTGDGPPPDDGGRRLVIASAADDYSAGGLAVIVDGAWHDVGSLHGDSVVSTGGGVTWAINRLGSDTVRRIDTLDGAPPTWEASVGRGGNPHAVAVVDGVALVTRYEETAAWRLDAATGDVLGEVDLSASADADGIPEMSSAVVDGDRVLVALQRLDRDAGWVVDPVGRVAIVDPGTGSVDAVLDVGPNPSLVAHPAGGALVVAQDGLWRVDADGLVAGPSRPEGVPGAIVGAAVAAGGSVVAIARQGAQHAVWCLDAWDARAGIEAVSLPAFLSDVVVDGDTAWVAVRRGWEDPSVAGGLAAMPVTGCGPFPSEGAWLRGTFAPYALAVRETGP